MEFNTEPFIHSESKSFFIVYKPPKMHCVPIRKNNSGTLVQWCAQYFPEILSITGKNPIEYSILHRLDYETNGLILFARTQVAMYNLLKQQQNGFFIKTYHANTEKYSIINAGFPPLPDDYKKFSNSNYPKQITSFFRPFEKGRKLVRPVLIKSNKNSTNEKFDFKNLYTTEIIKSEQLSDNSQFFVIRLIRGFRHQIRCHLAWLGYPILNDPLYNKHYSVSIENTKIMELTAARLSFLCPDTGKLLIFDL